MTNKSITWIIVTACLFSCSDYRQDRYTIIMDNVEGLKEGDVIVDNGRSVGHVEAMALYLDSVAVNVRLQKDYRLPKGSVFVLRNAFFGQNSLLIKSSSALQAASWQDTIRGYRDTTPKYFFHPDSVTNQEIQHAAKQMAEGLITIIKTLQKDSLLKKDSTN